METRKIKIEKIGNLRKGERKVYLSGGTGAMLFIKENTPADYALYLYGKAAYEKKEIEILQEGHDIYSFND